MHNQANRSPTHEPAKLPPDEAACRAFSKPSDGILGPSAGGKLLTGLMLLACNPPLAYKALQAEPEIGLLLPCNVIVYELDGKSSMVAAIDPNTMVGCRGSSPVMEEVARDARERLEKAIARVVAVNDRL